MPKQLTLDEPRQLSLLTSSGRVLAPVDVDENDERPGADARFSLADLVDVVGDCHACGMPALDFDTGGRRACRCGRGLCDPIAGTDCGTADGRCWDCYHADDEDLDHG